MDNFLDTFWIWGLIIGWLVAAAILIGWLISKKRVTKIKTSSFVNPKNAKQVEDQEVILLTIEVPKENDKTPMAAEALFSSLHGIGKDHLSFEIEADEKAIRFYAWMPKHFRGYVESQIYAQYPNINIFEVKDYATPAKIDESLTAVATELIFKRKDFYPIKTFQDFTVDPLSAITGTVSKLSDSEHVWIQMLIQPESDKWRDRALSFITAVKEGRTMGLGKAITKGLTGFTTDIVKTVLQGGAGETATKPVVKTELSPGIELVLKAIEEKSSKLGFRTKIRLVVWDKNEALAQNKLQLILGAFKQFNTNNLNAFEVGSYITDRQNILEQYSKRQFGQGGLILNVTELASIYHLPNLTVTTPNIVWAGARKGEPPANLPLVDEVPSEELTVLAKTNFRGEDEKFGIKLKDRARHVYVIGKTGTGKSTLLENMLIDDIRERRGAAVIDPHGDLVDTVLEYTPSYRANDIIVFDVGDRDFPIAVNMFEITDPKYKVVVASGVVGIFKKIFGYSWGPRLEYWLSSAVMALLDYPDPTLMMVPKIFTDKSFREKVVAKVQDPLIKDRWINEYSKLDQKQQAETISPILNKVGQFLSSPIIRNIVGQPKSSIYFRKLMDEGKILLVKLSKGLIGEDNAALLGSMIITQIQLAAMSRADIPEKDRRDFYLYVDEFQNFATDSFQMILSEARKYHLSLTLANQYMAQLTPEIGSAIRGNVNTIIAFRVGPEDAGPLETDFAPVFTANDLVNLNMFNIYLKISIDNLTTNAFSAQTLPLPTDKNGIQDKIVTISREQYAKPVSFVEEKIIANFEASSAQPSESKRYPDNRNYSNSNTDRNYDNRPRSYDDRNRNYNDRSRGYDDRRNDDRRLSDRPVPFRPGVKVSQPNNRSDGQSTAQSSYVASTMTSKSPVNQSDSRPASQPAPAPKQESSTEARAVNLAVNKTVNPSTQVPIERKKPIESLLKKVISSIEAKKPWVPGDKSSKSTNLISELKGDKNDLEEIRRQKSEEAGNNSPNL